MSTDTVPDIFEKPGVPYSTSADLYSTTQIGAALPTIETDSVVNVPMGGGAPSSDPLNITFNASDPIVVPTLIVGTPMTPVNTSTHYSGGPPPKVYSIFSGTLPPGLALNSGTGVISGTPTTPGVGGGFVVRGTDNAGNHANSNSVVVTVVAADPNYANVSLLLHCDGANGSQIITDNSQYADTKTIPSGAQVIDTATKVWGTGSLKCTIRNQVGLQYAQHAKFKRASNGVALAIEFWIRRVSSENATATPVICRLLDSASGTQLLLTQYALTNNISFDGVNPGFSYAHGASGFAFIQCLVPAGSNTMSFHVNGAAAVATKTIAGNIGTTGAFWFAGENAVSGSPIEVYLEDFRLTIGGTARTVGVPTEAFPNS